MSVAHEPGAYLKATLEGQPAELARLIPGFGRQPRRSRPREAIDRAGSVESPQSSRAETPGGCASDPEPAPVTKAAKG
jgi:hypothetical protein